MGIQLFLMYSLDALGILFLSLSQITSLYIYVFFIKSVLVWSKIDSQRKLHYWQSLHCKYERITQMY
jgi:hypothetical protein